MVPPAAAASSEGRARAGAGFFAYLREGAHGARRVAPYKILLVPVVARRRVRTGSDQYGGWFSCHAPMARNADQNARLAFCSSSDSSMSGT